MLKDIISLPTRRIRLPKSKQDINLRSFTVKERNSLQLGMQSDDNYTISSTLVNVIEACISEDVDVSKLPILDIEFIFLQMNKISVGRYIDVGYKCLGTYESEGNEQVCNHHTDVQFDIEEVQFDILEDEDEKSFKISEDVHIIFKKVNGSDLFDSFATITNKKQKFDLLEEQKKKYIECALRVLDGEKTIDLSTKDDEEVWGLLEYIPVNVMDEIDKFIAAKDNMFMVKTYKCDKCGTEHTIRHEGLEDFLG